MITSLAHGFTGSRQIVFTVVGSVVTDVAVAAKSVVVVEADLRDRVAIVMTVRTLVLARAGQIVPRGL